MVATTEGPRRHKRDHRDKQNFKPIRHILFFEGHPRPVPFFFGRTKTVHDGDRRIIRVLSHSSDHPICAGSYFFNSISPPWI